MEIKKGYRFFGPPCIYRIVGDNSLNAWNGPRWYIAWVHLVRNLGGPNFQSHVFAQKLSTIYSDFESN